VLYRLIEKVRVLFPHRAYGSLAMGLILLTLSPLAAENEPTSLWDITYNGSSNGNDHGNDIAVDDFGNVYITGFVQETQGGRNILVQKYDAAGTGATIKSQTIRSSGSSSKSAPARGPDESRREIVPPGTNEASTLNP